MNNSLKLKEIVIGLKLSKLNLKLSEAEATLCSVAYFKTELLGCFEDIFLFLIKTKSAKKLFRWLNRLAFAKEAFIVLSKISWEKEIFLYANTFSLKIGERSCFKIYNKTKNFEETKKVAKQVIKNNISKKVNLASPDLHIFIFQSHIGIKIWENKDKFELRKAHLKDAPHPTGLNPRLARAMINLSSAKQEILDPFCGAGGILEEAKIIGLSYYGVDISEEMIRRSEINLRSPRGLFLMDAFSWKESVECVVTDIPYGKSSILTEDINLLVIKIFKHFSPLTSKLVLCLPSDINLSFLETQNWFLVNSFEIYIHKSLTRKICILKRKK